MPMGCPRCSTGIMKLLRVETVASVQGSRTVTLQHVCRQCGYVYDSAKPETLLTEDEWVAWLGRRRPRDVVPVNGYRG
jgi:hypothetical protein